MLIVVVFQTYFAMKAILVFINLEMFSKAFFHQMNWIYTTDK
jgi:hypothetical protein